MIGIEGQGPSQQESAGKWALNSDGSLVAAWDDVRTPKGDTHTYLCSCKCGAPVALKRSEARLKIPHFAYIATDRIGCSGGTVYTPESEDHYKAKWLLHDLFSTKTFRDVCAVDHVLKTYTYKAPEWKAMVEKKIPGTNRIADVLLRNDCTGEAVALEVCHTHAVDHVKYTECKKAGVHLIELSASDVNKGLDGLNNLITSPDWTTCCTCVKDRKRRQEEQQREDEWWDQRTKWNRKRLEELREFEKIKKEKQRVDDAARVERNRLQEEIKKKEREERELQEEREREERKLQEEREREECKLREERDKLRKEREREERKLREECDRVEREKQERVREVIRKKLSETQARVRAEQEIVWAAATRKRRRAEMAAALASNDRSALWAMGALRGPVEF
ncbi:hypothetical protein T484DRAFT_1755108 [Baffinella frigidus]|nr:hypothetical protein T484DRAFT_1755108 [Cryptophyta sp. CCMP2293]